MDNELKINIIRAIAGHYISRDEMNDSLIYEQAETIQKFLEEQKKIYEDLKKTKCAPHKLKTNSNGEIVFEAGTLIHLAGECNFDKLCGIKEKGIMAGDFVGIPEFDNDESYFCADFYRADKQMQSSDLIKRIEESDRTPSRGPFGKGLKSVTKMAFIFDSTEELSKLTDTDMYRPENMTHTMQSALKLLESYKGEKNGQISAIPYGIPSSFISGIIAGDGLLQDKSYIELINKIFPNCYILNRDGKIFFSPELTPEQNKANQLKCLESIPEQEEWRQERVKNTIGNLLSSAIEATEETTRIGAINQQAESIREIKQSKTMKKNKVNKNIR